jgi:hypothetical protein
MIVFSMFVFSNPFTFHKRGRHDWSNCFEYDGIARLGRIGGGDETAGEEVAAAAPSCTPCLALGSLLSRRMWSPRRIR